MKLAPSTGILAALLSLVVGMMIGATLTRTVDQWPLDEVSAEDWFFIDVFDCKFPIPNAYLVQKSTASDELRLYYDGLSPYVEMYGDVYPYYPVWISIRPIEGEYQHYYTDDFDLKYETLKQHNDLTYEHMTYDGKHGFYIIRNRTQMVRLAGGSRELADLMFDYCASHPIEESGLDCERRDGKTWCSLNQ